MNAHARIRVLFGFLLLSLIACSRDSVRVVPVSGKVSLDGTLLKKGSVVFWPNKDKGNNSPHEAAAQIDADGTFELYTKGRAGAVPGHYKVTVNASTEVSSTEPLKGKLLVPQKYTKRETTPLLLEVVESPASGRYDLTVK
jgi:hypothetical protein